MDEIKSKFQHGYREEEDEEEEEAMLGQYINIYLKLGLIALMATVVSQVFSILSCPGTQMLLSTVTGWWKSHFLFSPY